MGTYRLSDVYSDPSGPSGGGPSPNSNPNFSRGRERGPDPLAKGKEHEVELLNFPVGRRGDEGDGEGRGRFRHEHHEGHTRHANNMGYGRDERDGGSDDRNAVNYTGPRSVGGNGGNRKDGSEGYDIAEGYYSGGYGFPESGAPRESDGSIKQGGDYNPYSEP